jgi:hypothetical protein
MEENRDILEKVNVLTFPVHSIIITVGPSFCGFNNLFDYLFEIVNICKKNVKYVLK